MRGVLRSSGERHFGPATCWQQVQSFEELQGKAFWFGGMAGGAVTVTGNQEYIATSSMVHMKASYCQKLDAIGSML